LIGRAKLEIHTEMSLKKIVRSDPFWDQDADEHHTDMDYTTEVGKMW